MDKLTSKRTFFLRLMRRKLARDLDDMGYPGGKETGTNKRPVHTYKGLIVDAGRELSSQRQDSASKEQRRAEQH